MLYHAELLVCSDVEEPAGGVVRPCGESVPVREELRNGGRVILTTQQKNLRPIKQSILNYL